MAYLFGLVTKEERRELERRGWEVESAKTLTEELLSTQYPEDMVGVYVDSELFEVMSGPDWDKSGAGESPWAALNSFYDRAIEAGVLPATDEEEPEEEEM